MGAGRAHGTMGPWAEPWAKKKVGAGPGPGPRAAPIFFFDPGLSPWAHGSMDSARANDFILALVFLYVFIFSRKYLLLLIGSRQKVS